MPIGIRTHECEVTVLGQHDQVVAREHHLTVSVASALPFELTGLGIDRREDAFIETVDHTVAQNGSGESILHPVVPPDLAHREVIAASAQLDHRGASTIARGHEHAVVSDHQRLRRVDPVVGRERILPEHLSVAGDEAHHSRCADDEQLPHTVQRDEHRRAIRLFVVERRPDAFPGGTVVADDRAPVGSAGQHDDRVIDDERRSGHAPVEVVGVAVAQDVGAPDHLAAGIVESTEFSCRTERVHLPVRPRRRGSRAVSAHRLAEFSGPRVRPELATRGHVVRGDHLLRSALLDRECATTSHDEGGVAAADRLLPQRHQSRRSASRQAPVLRDTRRRASVRGSPSSTVPGPLGVATLVFAAAAGSGRTSRDHGLNGDRRLAHRPHAVRPPLPRAVLRDDARCALPARRSSARNVDMACRHRPSRIAARRTGRARRRRPRARRPRRRRLSESFES